MYIQAVSNIEKQNLKLLYSEVVMSLNKSFSSIISLRSELQSLFIFEDVFISFIKKTCSSELSSRCWSPKMAYLLFFDVHLVL